MYPCSRYIKQIFDYAVNRQWFLTIIFSFVVAGRLQRQRRGCSRYRLTSPRIGTSILTRLSNRVRCIRCSRSRTRSPRFQSRRASLRYLSAYRRGPVLPPSPCNMCNSSHVCAPSPRRKLRNFKSKSALGPISPKPTPNHRTLYHNKWQSPITLKLPQNSSSYHSKLFDKPTKHYILLLMYNLLFLFYILLFISWSEDW